MSLLHIAILASVQGITEFLPISSSGHLALVPIITGWHDQGLEIDIAVHIGTLGAVVCYFWRDSWSAFSGLFQLFGSRSSADSQLAANLIIATIPIIGAGAAVIYLDMTDLWRSPEIIGWSMLGFGILLFVADRFGTTVRRVEHMQVGAALAIGIAQVAALIPGTSRSGVTITAARLLGFERGESARFSMLLSIPTIIAAGSISLYGIMTTTAGTLNSDAIIAAACALVAALIAITLLMAWLQSQSFTLFVVYRITLGAGLLYWVYF